MIQKNILLKKFSTFGIGGEADFFAEISGKDDLLEALNFAEKNELNTFFLGGGSNLLFSDKGIRGMVLHFKNVEISSFGNGKFCAESGVKMGEIFGFTKKENRDFALFSTLPGTIGGATAGNAGLPKQEIKDIFCEAELYDRREKKFVKADADFFNFQYRKTAFHHPEISGRYVIWSVTFELAKKKEEEIEFTLKEYFEMRKAKQPWGKTCGSFFFNPKEGAAGYFLDQAGMKGFAVGDAFFSEKHANFLMNKKNATQEEVKTLARLGQKKVQEKFEITLLPEVKILDEFGKVEEL